MLVISSITILWFQYDGNTDKVNEWLKEISLFRYFLLFLAQKRT